MNRQLNGINLTKIIQKIYPAKIIVPIFYNYKKIGFKCVFFYIKLRGNIPPSSFLNILKGSFGGNPLYLLD
jgi:hypothetical protein